MTIAVLMLDVRQHLEPDETNPGLPDTSRRRRRTTNTTSGRSRAPSAGEAAPGIVRYASRTAHTPTVHPTNNRGTNVFEGSQEELNLIVTRVTALMHSQAFQYLNPLQQHDAVPLSEPRSPAVAQGETPSHTSQEFLSGVAEELDAGMEVLKGVRFASKRKLNHFFSAQTIIKKSLFSLTGKVFSNTRAASRRLAGMQEETEEEQTSLPLSKRLENLFITIKLLKLLESHATMLNNSSGYVVVTKLVECFGNVINCLKENPTSVYARSEKQAPLLHLGVQLCDVLQKMLASSYSMQEFLLLQTNILQIIKSHIRNQGWHNTVQVTKLTPHGQLMLEKSVYALLVSLSRRVSADRTVDKKIINVLSFSHLLSRLQLMLKETKLAPLHAEEGVTSKNSSRGKSSSRISPAKTTSKLLRGRTYYYSINKGPISQEDLELTGCTLSAFLFYMRDRNPQWWGTAIMSDVNYAVLNLLMIIHFVLRFEPNA